MATRRLVREVLYLCPEHKTSRIILDLVYEALQKHLSTFESSVHFIGDNVKTRFSAIVREMFSDGVRHWGRVAIVFAFAIFMQQRFKVDLEEETTVLIEDFVADWIEAQGRYNEAILDFDHRYRLSFIHYLIGTSCLFLLLDICRM